MESDWKEPCITQRLSDTRLVSKGAHIKRLVYDDSQRFEKFQLIQPLHPWAGEDLSLKIDDHDQNTWIFILEL